MVKSPAKKSAAKKSPAKKSAAKKSAAKKSPAKKELPAATVAKELHRKARRHNWDDGTRKLEAILANKACDFGTALLIYWMGAPGFDQQYKTAKDLGDSDWRKPVFTFLRALETRLKKRDFATANILFNPRFDRTTVNGAGHDWSAEYDDIKVVRPIPAALMEPSCSDTAWEARGKKPLRNTANRLT